MYILSFESPAEANINNKIKLQGDPHTNRQMQISRNVPSQLKINNRKVVQESNKEPLKQ